MRAGTDQITRNDPMGHDIAQTWIHVSQFTAKKGLKSLNFLKEIFRCVKETDVKKIFSIIIPLTICIRLSAPHNGIELVWI